MEAAQWNHPSLVVAAATDMTWLWIVLLLLGGIGFIVAGLGVSGKLPLRPRSSPPADNNPAKPSPAMTQGTKYCPQCGTANPLKAGFCTKCGNQFPSQ